MLKVADVTKEVTEDKYEVVWIGFCPKCGKRLRKDSKGEDDECCGEYLEWEIEEDRRTFGEKMGDFWAEVDYGY